MSSLMENTLRQKEELIRKVEMELIGDQPYSLNPRSVSVRKKIVTYENLLRFYQNSIVTFALEGHTHYAADILTDAENRFVTDKQLESIKRFTETTTATNEQILALFNV